MVIKAMDWPWEIPEKVHEELQRAEDKAEGCVTKEPRECCKKKGAVDNV